MNIEMRKENQEVRKSAKEGGLEVGIEKMRKDISSLMSMVDQIEKLQKVPHGYLNLAGEGAINKGELPALDQTIEYRGTYDHLQSKSEEALSASYQAIMKQLSLLRDMTGIHSAEEAMKFDKDTGRQPKDI